MGFWQRSGPYTGSRTPRIPTGHLRCPHECRYGSLIGGAGWLDAKDNAVTAMRTTGPAAPRPPPLMARPQDGFRPGFRPNTVLRYRYNAGLDQLARRRRRGRRANAGGLAPCSAGSAMRVSHYNVPVTTSTTIRRDETWAEWWSDIKGVQSVATPPLDAPHLPARPGSEMDSAYQQCSLDSSLRLSSLL